MWSSVLQCTASGAPNPKTGEEGGAQRERERELGCLESSSRVDSSERRRAGDLVSKAIKDKWHLLPSFHKKYNSVH